MNDIFPPGWELHDAQCEVVRLRGRVEELERQLAEVIRLFPGIALREAHPHRQDICRHGLTFLDHCNECSIAGYCGCPECTEAT